MKLPINFKEFSKDPKNGLLYIILPAIGYLYVDQKMTNNQIKEDYKKEIAELKAIVLLHSKQLKKSDSALAAATTKIEIYTQLGKIPKK
jgi:hypothetical protein